MVVLLKLLRNRILVGLLLVVPLIGYGQEKKYPLGLALDYQFLQNKSYSIGFGIMHYNKPRGIKEGWRLEYEMMETDNLKNGKIHGAKVEGYLAYNKFFNFGYGLGYYFDSNNYKVIFNPEFGLGYQSIFLVYRRNMTIINGGLDDLNKNNVSIRMYVPLDKTWFRLGSS